MASSTPPQSNANPNSSSNTPSPDGITDEQADNDQSLPRANPTKARTLLGLADSAPIVAEHQGLEHHDLLWSRIRLACREPFAEFFGTFIMVLFGDGLVHFRAVFSLSSNVMAHRFPNQASLIPKCTQIRGPSSAISWSNHFSGQEWEWGLSVDIVGASTLSQSPTPSLLKDI